MLDNTSLKKQFKIFLIRQDLSEISIAGYIQDLSVFIKWLTEFYEEEIVLTRVSVDDISAYREYLTKILRRKPATINRHIQVLKRFYTWTKQKGIIKNNPAVSIRFARRTALTKPMSLNKPEIHALLRVAGQSLHGLAKRNYCFVQILLQTGLRISEVANLQIRDLILRDRSGSLRVVDGKGRKHRDIPLNTTARYAITAYLKTKAENKEDDFVFTTKRGGKSTVRALQKIIQGLAKKAKVSRIKITAHTLRHTFATQYLRANPDGLVELALLMGHDSVNTTAVYTKSSKEQLEDGVERSEINVYGE